MDRLYILQYVDDPYTAPYSGEIFKTKDAVVKYINNNDLIDLVGICVYEYSNETEEYQMIELIDCEGLIND